MAFAFCYILRRFSVADVNANAVFIHQKPAHEACERNHHDGHERHPKAKGIDIDTHIVNAQKPIISRHRKHHDREYSMTPASDETSYTRHANQINQANKACDGAKSSADACQPEPSSRKKIFLCGNESNVSCNESYQGGNRKMNHHGMNRMAENGHAASNGFMCHFCKLCHLWHFFICMVVDKRVAMLMMICTSFFLAGCDGPQSMLAPAGPAALAVSRLWWGMLIFFTLVLFGISFLGWYAMQPRKEPLPDKSANRLANYLIIGGGILLPLVSIVVILLFGIPAGIKMLPSQTKGEKALRIDVTAHQWYWEFYYPEYDITTRDQLWIPVKRPIDIYGTSHDVIHSFWVPRLNGKIDLIPGYQNHLRLQASTHGTFRGQCAEFCGKWHARMIFWVKAGPEEEFERWVQGQKNKPQLLSAVAQEND